MKDLMQESLEEIRKLIVEVQDFPKPGILFRDISPLLKSPLFRLAIQKMGEIVVTPDFWAGVDSRGFIFASALSLEFGGGILLCRKKNKLPPPKVSVEYRLEYGTDTLEMQTGSGTVVLVDDVLATGGTMVAAGQLMVKAGYELRDRLVLINLKMLNNITNVKSLIDYE